MEPGEHIHRFTIFEREITFNPETLEVSDPSVARSDDCQGEQTDSGTPALSSGFQSLVLILTDACNLKCSYCYERIRPSNHQTRRMSQEMAKKGIDLFLSGRHSDDLSITLFGGEPMLWWEHIPDLVRYANAAACSHNSTIHWSISTNGTCLPDDAVTFFAEHRFQFLIDIDGTEENHNHSRPYGSGGRSYGTICATYQKLKEKTPSSIMLRATATPEYPYVYELFQALTELSPDNIAVYPSFFETFRVDWSEERLYTLLDGYSQMATHIRDQGILQGAEGYAYLFPFSIFLSHLCAREQKNRYCSGYGQTLAVSPSGTLYPCAILDGTEDFSLGDLNAGLQNSAIAQWHSLSSIQNRPVCRACWARTLCGGGCIAHTIQTQGIAGPDSSFECVVIRHLSELSLWLYAEFLDKRPDFFLSLIPGYRRIWG